MSQAMAAPIDFTIPFGYSDVVFLIEGNRVHATKAILAMSSPIFCDIFGDDSGDEISLDDVDYEAFIELMRVVHPPPKEINGSNVRTILPLSVQYDMAHVVQQCEKYLLTEEFTVANLVLAEAYNLESLSHRIQQWAVGIPIEQLREEPGFLELRRTALTDILLEKLQPRGTKIQTNHH